MGIVMDAPVKFPAASAEVDAVAPASESTIGSLAANPEPLTVMVAKGACEVALDVMLGERGFT